MNSVLQKYARGDNDALKPAIFSLKNTRHQNAVRGLLRKGKIQRVVARYEDQIKELFEIKNPKKAFLAKQGKVHKRDPKEGLWVYYPWNFSLVHILHRSGFRRVRTARNQNIITASEQKKLERATIGIAGLNVGNPAALCLALEGFEKMKLADNDILSLSNLNRFRAGIHQIGMDKTYLTAQQINEINPFTKLTIFSNGITQENLEKFFLKPRIDVLIEEMDNLKLKIFIREKAKKFRIPVVMVTGNGENIILDVERYDTNQNLPILNGYLQQVIVKRIERINPQESTIQEKVLLARDFMGAKYLTERLRKSFLQVGSQLSGIPQIAEASFMRGAVLCYAVRQIVLGAHVPSGRFLVNLSDIF